MEFIACTFLFVRFLGLAAASVAVAFLRRHLLIWSDFAPRWLFEVWLFAVETVVFHMGLAGLASLAARNRH